MLLQVEFYLKFKEWCQEQGNDIPVGLRTFQYCKPYFIRVLKDMNVCCCKAHVEMDLLKQALNRWREKHHEASDCHCICASCLHFLPCMLLDEGIVIRCEAPKTMLSSVREWCEEIVCLRATGEIWHKKNCIMGKCKECGVKKLGICSTEEVADTPIAWETFEYTQLEKSGKRNTDGNEEKPGKRLRMVYMETTVLQFFQKVSISSQYSHI